MPQPLFTDPEHIARQHTRLTVRSILAELSGMPPAEICDAMTIRCDLGLTGSQVFEALRGQFEQVDMLTVTDPAALVHNVEDAVR